MFGRFRRGAMRGGARPNVPPLLRKAHELMTAGNFSAAAEAFETLAQKAEARAHPRTPQLYLQAGRARIMARQKPAGFILIKKGLSLAKNQPAQLSRLGNAVLRELNEHGMQSEAQELTAWLKTVTPEASAAARTGTFAAGRKPILPTRCPGCGGVVRTDEVEWTDEMTAECSWCGTPLRAEG